MSRRGFGQLIPALALLAATGDPFASLEIPRPRQLRLKKVRKNDPRVALQYRMERRVRKAISYRKQNKLPPVTEDEIREWAKEEAENLGLTLKEESDGGDHASEPDDQG